jgi:hypothetical protein
LGVVMTLTVAALLRLRTPAWIRRRLRRNLSGRVAKPTISFYAETLDQLARVGVDRKASQTPSELAAYASEKLAHPMIPPVATPLHVLTTMFYRLRFGHMDDPQAGLETTAPFEHARQRNPEVAQALAELTQSVDLLMVNSSHTERTT